MSEFLSENFPFLVVKFSIYLNRHVFVISSVESFLCGLVAACCGFFRAFFLVCCLIVVFRGSCLAL